MRVSTLFMLTVICISCSDDGTDQSDRPRSLVELEYHSPLKEALGVDSWWDSSFAKADRTVALARATAIEEQVSMCMQAQGFAYVAVDRSPLMITDPVGGLPRYSEDWIDRFGFGLSTHLFAQSEYVNTELVGWDDTGQEVAVLPNTPDPNLIHQAGLAEAEFRAYMKALYGEDPWHDPAEHEGQGGTPAGCFAEAEEKVAAPGRLFEFFAEEFADLRAAFSADPRVIQHRAEVSRCVAGEGLQFDSIDVERERWLTELEPALYQIQSNVPAMMPEPGKPIPVLSIAQEDYLLQLQSDERRLARVVVDCGGGELNELIALADVQATLEQEFVEVHGERLALWVAEHR